MNKVILIGRLTKDPELRRTPTDVPVARFTLAVNRSYQNQNGERQADFINCVAWRAQAENLARYIKKGGLVAVEGSIQVTSYDDQNGVRRIQTDVVCNQVTFLEAKKQNSNDMYNDFSQLTPPEAPRYNNYNNNNNNYNNNQNNAPAEDNKPFKDIDDSYDISSDDFPW